MSSVTGNDFFNYVCVILTMKNLKMVTFFYYDI